MFAPNDEVDQDAEHDQEEVERDTTVASIEDVEQGSEVSLPTSHFHNEALFQAN